MKFADLSTPLVIIPAAMDYVARNEWWENHRDVLRRPRPTTYNFAAVYPNGMLENPGFAYPLRFTDA